MSQQLGSRLEQLIKELGLNQGEFARKLACSPAFISEVIRGKKRPGADFLANLSETFNVSLDWLVCGRSVDPISGSISPKISFQAFQAVALRTELVLAASKGNKAAMSMIKSLLNGQSPVDNGPEFELLKLNLKTRMEEYRFIVEQYNSKSASDNLDTLAETTLNEAVERFAILSEDHLFSVINS